MASDLTGALLESDLIWESASCESRGVLSSFIFYPLSNIEKMNSISKQALHWDLDTPRACETQCESGYFLRLRLYLASSSLSLHVLWQLSSTLVSFLKGSPGLRGDIRWICSFNIRERPPGTRPGLRTLIVLMQSRTGLPGYS